MQPVTPQPINRVSQNQKPLVIMNRKKESENFSTTVVNEVSSTVRSHKLNADLPPDKYPINKLSNHFLVDEDNIRLRK
jgi:mRNA-degrading endonuclease toxin of MazEF toxin-antitoxin module